ncbi:MAG: enoyl-CoA hydratase/isomerase family protein [Dehalococcoidia bacterium]|nr:enoyl-CoA hydratase/isomerase family protein [Dehalococcoidia bacterium]
MTPYQTIIYEKQGPVARVTLNRPDVLNAYNVAMRDEMYEALEAIRDDPEVRGVVLCGAGDRAFCAGADLTEFGTAPSQAIARQVRWERDVWGLFTSLDIPLVAAVHGYVLGSGLEIALLCDIRVAAEDAVFGLPETSLGMLPAAGGTQTLPRVFGPGPALDLLLTGRRINAREAYNLGLVAKVVPRYHLMAEAQAVVEGILASGSDVLRSAKRALQRGMDMTLAQGLELEARMALDIFRARRGPIPAWRGAVET